MWRRQDMTEYEKLHSGELYLPGDEEIMKEQLACLDKLYDFNMTRPTEFDKREKMLSEMFAEIGEHDKEFYFKNRKINL